MRGNLRTRKAVKRGSHVLARLAATESRSQLNLFCRHPWLLAWPHATNLELSAARPPTLRVCVAGRVVRVRPVHQPARAAKAPRGRHSDSRRKPPAAPPTVPHPSRRSSTGGRYRTVTAPARNRTAPAPPATATLLLTTSHAAIPGSKPVPACDETPPEPCPSDPRAPTKIPCRRRYRQLRSRQQACGR